MLEIIDHIKEFLTSIDVATLGSLGAWSYFVLAFLVAIEGPIATLLGALAASAGVMNPIFVFVSAAAGNLTADTVWYSIGLLGKIDWLLRYSRRLRINPGYLEQIEAMLRMHAPLILFISKLIVSPMIPMLIATGLIKHPWRRWFPYVFLGEMIWTGSLVTIGYYGLQAIQKLEVGIEHYILVGTMLFIVVIFWLGRRMLKKEMQTSGKEIENKDMSEVR